ncbi:MAG: hypothetical protein J6J82_02515 [Alphaproteobacteria bacterium]|nr:hypothetical protein [Alphaproteobacteria bacterium]
MIKAYCAVRSMEKVGILGIIRTQGDMFMKTETVAKSLKNAVSTVFLLAGAFFVCSTFLSMRAVFADPVAPVMDPSLMAPQAQRAGTTARTSGRASPRNRQTTNRATVARSTIINAARNQATNSRNVATRNVVSRSAVQNPRANAVTTRNTNTVATPSRSVVSRQNVTANRAGATKTRTVRARTATTDAANNARISLQGSAIRGSKAAPSSTYSYLNTKLYTGNYSNIIDSSTGMISADAYSNCLESYYTCMDEICTARNQAQRRCGCAGRVKAFAEAEAALETANEELIKVSGELALLVANKGKDVSEAFKLTDAEKVMNCVSWQEASKDKTWTADEATEWCHAHGMYDESKCSQTQSPSYCSEENNNFGFDIASLDGNGSDILASLQSWANAKDKTVTILTKDDKNVLSAFDNVSSVVGNLAGINGAFSSTETSADTLATTWGYDLFEYAHDNVCSRVLDSCFNGIYEACGSPSTFSGKCANGQTSNCPFNYNSNIDVTADGNITLNERGTSTNTNTSATCFGYTTTSGDPYSSLRGPVADARRSIINKYLLDANADCDAYGEQLRAAAQNISYQKVAAQQALQQKRLEFKLEEEESVLASAQTAMSNFNECLTEIYDCYTETADSENWPTARIKTFCSQVANIPHCYEEMICSPSMAQFNAVIDKTDNTQCKNTQDYTTNTCRNVITLNEILNGTGATQEEVSEIETAITSGTLFGPEVKQNSIALREHCLQKAMGIEDGKETQWDIRGWEKPAEEDKD